jgi:hypothetical protein
VWVAGGASSWSGAGAEQHRSGEIADALADQADYEHHTLINPDTGEIAFPTADTGIDGQTPVDLDELGLLVIDPLPSWVWYQDMADFADGITDERAGRRLARAIQGKGAFRRFKDELHCDKAMHRGADEC